MPMGCSLYIKYIGETNYFREANTNLFALISNLELANETAIYINNDMHGIASNLSNSLVIISDSTRVNRP